MNGPYAFVCLALFIAAVLLMLFGLLFDERILVKAGQVLGALAIGCVIASAITGNRLGG